MHFAEFIAGWISGAVGLAVGHPMDTIKVRLQTQLKYRGILDCMIKIYKHERIPGFFKGMSFPVLSVAVGNAVVFSSYSNALEFISQSQRGDRSSSSSSVEIFVAGCFSGAAQVLVMAPVDLVKVRLQNQSHPHWTVSGGGTGGPQYRGPVNCVASILRQEGVPGLYRGVGALALRDIPCYGLYFLPYELLCRVLTEEGQQPGTAAVLVAGGCAGMVTWSCATPMDVVKARLQMEGVQGQRYGGVLACVRESVRAEGGGVLFKGLLANSVRAFPVNAVTFLTYESLLRGMQ
ncbi:solute carrier family 25 member 45 isoform X1 [Acipenser oxyrinchus oxyrinchus]|uniref:Solute carrier family 25 member 45 isoform X1 n=1 Tax=Acipenser oxyrinchus oxyrinchus TaxID=40147 RepID=A0AAD8CQ11_ACIOX|nr:solute carrier family 25 member 45 isoform X1 [Acipenser oxyrinchus oxyrinchus]